MKMKNKISGQPLIIIALVMFIGIVYRESAIKTAGKYIRCVKD